MLMRFKSDGLWYKVENLDRLRVVSDTADGVTSWLLQAGGSVLATYTTETEAQAALEAVLDQVGSEDLA